MPRDQNPIEEINAVAKPTIDQAHAATNELFSWLYKEHVNLTLG